MKKPENAGNGGTKRNYTEVKEFSVIRTKMFDNGNVVFDLSINGVSIYGCRVVEGKQGDFISFPQRKGGDGKYYHIAYASLSQDDQGAILAAVERELNG